MRLCGSLALLLSVRLPGYSDIRNPQDAAKDEWILVRPLSVSTTAIETPNGARCFIGIAYDANSISNVAVALSRHCLNIVGITALVQAEAADGDTEEIKLAIRRMPTAGAFIQFSHISTVSNMICSNRIVLPWALQSARITVNAIAD
jgi:hypothetical protein